MNARGTKIPFLEPRRGQFRSRGRLPGLHDPELSVALTILQPICERFTEGFDTSDWRAAAALRSELD